MIIDTSSWVDYSRSPDGQLGDRVEAALADGSAMTVDVVRLELLSGLAAPARHVLNGVLAACTFLPQESIFDVDTAIEVFQRCRRGGETVRSPNDCLIAAIAIRAGVSVLHRDGDFDVIARHNELEAIRG